MDGGAFIGGLFLSLIFLAVGIWLTWRIIEKAGYPGWYALAIGVIGFILGLIPFVGFLVQLAQLGLLYAFAFVRWPKDGGALPFGGAIPGIAGKGFGGGPAGYPPQAGYPPPTGYPPQPGGYPPPGYPQQPGGYPPPAGGYPPGGYPPPQPQGYPPQQPYGQPPGYPPPQGGPGGYGQPPVPPPSGPVPGPGGYQPPVPPPSGYGQPPVPPPASASPSSAPSQPAGAGDTEATVIAGRSMPSASAPAPTPLSPTPAAPPPAPTSGGGWTLSTPGPGGQPFVLTLTEGKANYLVTGQSGGGDLIVPEASIGNPHARLHLAPGRLGLEDLGSPGGTAIDGAQLLPSHGIREVTQSKKIRFGALEFSLSRQ